MKMFLTRLGFGSTAVVTGDLTQIDLPKHVKSGLRDAEEVLHDVEGVSFTFFESRDVLRHPLVARLVNAYEHPDAQDAATGPAQTTPMPHGPVLPHVPTRSARPRARLPPSARFRHRGAAPL